MILSDTFQVMTDVLLRDELEISGAKKVNTCGNNALQKVKKELYEGALIKESIEDDSIIDYLSVNKIELWNTGGNPKYWTVLFFTSSERNLPELFSKVMISGEVNWFVDFKEGNQIYIVFRKRIFYLSGRGIEPVPHKLLDTTYAVEKDKWDEMIKYAKSLGVPDNQCDFLPENFEKQKYC